MKEEDKSFPFINNNNFVKIFSEIGKAIAKIDWVAIGNSILSSKCRKYEFINKENKKGWHKGDGILFIFGYKFKKIKIY